MKRKPRLIIHDTLYVLLEGRTIRDKLVVLDSCIPNFRESLLKLSEGFGDSEYLFIGVDDNFTKGLGSLRLKSFNDKGKPCGGLDYYLVKDESNRIKPCYLENHYLNLDTEDLKGLLVLCGNLLKSEYAFLVIRKSYGDFEVSAYSVNQCGSGVDIGVFRYSDTLTIYSRDVLRPSFLDRVILGRALNQLKGYYEGSYYDIYICRERGKYRIDVRDQLCKLHPLAEIDDSGNINPLGEIKDLPRGLLELVKLQKPLVRVHECLGIYVDRTSYLMYTDSKAYGTYRIRS